MVNVNEKTAEQNPKMNVINPPAVATESSYTYCSDCGERIETCDICYVGFTDGDDIWCNDDSDDIRATKEGWDAHICENCAIEAGLKKQEGNPGGWTMERRKKFRHETGADTTHRPPPHTRQKFWVKGHARAGVPVTGHYRKANPENPTVYDYQTGEQNPPVKVTFTCPTCNKTFAQDREGQPGERRKCECANGEWMNYWVWDEKGGSPSPPPEAPKPAGEPEVEVSLGSLALDNPPCDHVLKYVGLANPKEGGKVSKIFQCLKCKKHFKKGENEPKPEEKKAEEPPKVEEKPAEPNPDEGGKSQ
jgi:hypothetical protein